MLIKNFSIMADSVEVFFSLGSNLDPRGAYLAAMRRELQERIARFDRVSAIYVTAPWGFTADLPFLNQVVMLRTELAPEQLLAIAQSIETLLARQRSGADGYASRTADIDILLYGDAQIDTPQLRVPHPRMAQRRFVLAPLAEINAEGCHPRFGRSWRQLLDECSDGGKVCPTQDPAGRERGAMEHLIGDGGATAAKWLAMDAGGHARRFATQGLNPLYASADDVTRALRDAYGGAKACLGVGRVEFYGASCGPGQQPEVLREGLQRAFPLAEVHVDSDMALAARATWGSSPRLPSGQRAIVAILGTGSNACYLDAAAQPVYVTPSVGFLFGDEGSGAWLGKRLVRDWLYSALPEVLSNDMYALLAKEFGQRALRPMRGMEAIVARAYRGERPSAWFGSFARLLGAYRGDAYVEGLLAEGFGEFARYFLLPLAGYGGVEVRAVGSVAWYFRDALARSCASVGLRLGRVVKDPLGASVEGL